MNKAKKVCVKALEAINKQWLDKKIDSETMEIRSDKMIYNFLVCSDLKEIADMWYLNKT